MTASASSTAVTMKAWRRLASTRRMMSASIAASGLAVDQQNEADENEGDGPHPCGDAAFPPVEPELEPARPAGGDAAKRQRHMGDLDQELLFYVGKRVRVGEEQRAARRGDQRKDECRAHATEAAGAHPPFKQREGGD